MYEFFRDLDRRWIFLMMFLCVAVPIIIIGATGKTFPEEPTQLVRAVFDEIENLPSGSKVLLSYDYDPASEGELAPMATMFAYHCAAKGHKMYFMALWPVGPQMVDDTIENIIKKDFKDLKYGEDYVNLGYKSGYEGVIKVIITDFTELYSTDTRGTPWSAIPMCHDVNSVQDMDLIVNVSAGYAGTKEWVQYAVTPYPKLRMVAGCTGVQAPLLYPYIPQQLHGLLGAIKGAAEYEALVIEAYGDKMARKDAGDNPLTDDNGDYLIPGKYTEGIRRMGPQLVAHLLMILLIIVGNVIYFVERRREGRR
ncbi:MAG: hypothetical protein JSV91_06725 [Phycisphaerales bacterium]|nr:MAG: hypothetical protein JSV91_06725 [Phycisphaerales bacterium]